MAATLASLDSVLAEPLAGCLLRDAFFLPDMVPGRLHREVLGPLGAAGMPLQPADAAGALGVACAALSAALAGGREIPSEAHQSVISRMLRLQAALGRPDAPGTAGGTGDVG